MSAANRKAKVTSENCREAERLRELWNSRSHPSQAEFGETYGIGNQSAVGQFLRGETPLSLNAAKGFAQGLGCQIKDFSPRLAALTQERWPFPLVDPVRFSGLSPEQRGYVQARMIQAIEECERVAVASESYTAAEQFHATRELTGNEPQAVPNNGATDPAPRRGLEAVRSATRPALPPTMDRLDARLSGKRHERDSVGAKNPPRR